MMFVALSQTRYKRTSSFIYLIQALTTGTAEVIIEIHFRCGINYIKSANCLYMCGICILYNMLSVAILHYNKLAFWKYGVNCGCYKLSKLLPATDTVWNELHVLWKFVNKRNPVLSIIVAISKLIAMALLLSRSSPGGNNFVDSTM